MSKDYSKEKIEEMLENARHYDGYNQFRNEASAIVRCLLGKLDDCGKSDVGATESVTPKCDMGKRLFGWFAW